MSGIVIYIHEIIREVVTAGATRHSCKQDNDTGNKKDTGVVKRIKWIIN